VTAVLVAGHFSYFEFVSLPRQRKQEHEMAEKKVPYQVNGRQFEGMIVYDDSVKGKRRQFSCSRTGRSLPRYHRTGPYRRR